MIMPYLHFPGTCEEAFRFYAETFDGEITALSRLNNDPNNNVMHAQVRLTESGGSISGSDTVRSDKDISGMEILVFLPSRERVEQILPKLAAGGAIISEFAPHPPPDDEGGGAAVLDKYGYTWFLCV